MWTKLHEFVYFLCDHINQVSITTKFQFDSTNSFGFRGYVSARGKIMYCVLNRNFLKVTYAMCKSQILDFSFHSLDQNSLVRFLLDNPHHPGTFSRWNKSISKIWTRFVNGYQLAVAILEIPTVIDNVAGLQLGWAHFMISATGDNVDLKKITILNSEFSLNAKENHLIAFNGKTVDGSTKLNHVFGGRSWGLKWG